MSERDNRVKAFEKLMRGGLSSTDVFCLKNQLMAMGFFTAPASTKYHGNYEGGLFDHSFTVTSSLLSLTKRMGLNWKRKASPYIVGMPVPGDSGRCSLRCYRSGTVGGNL